MVCAADFPDGQIAAPDTKESRFQRTAIFLQNADAELQADFASVALSRLAHVYMAEAELARDEFQRERKDRKLLAWSQAVERYAHQLPLLQEDIELGFPVFLRPDQRNTLTVAVGDRVVMLSHPRSDQQAAFEQSILALFCARHPCNEFTPSTDSVSAIPVSTAQIKPEWNFSENGPVCSHQQISVEFSRKADLAHARTLCTQFLHEAMSLAQEISWQHRHGVDVDWLRLSMHATPGRPEHRIQLNSLGDSILIVAPLLHRSPELLQDLQGWFKSEMSGDEAVPVILKASKYGWES